MKKRPYNHTHPFVGGDRSQKCTFGQPHTPWCCPEITRISNQPLGRVPSTPLVQLRIMLHEGRWWPLLCRQDLWANLWISRHLGNSGAPRGLCRRQEAPGGSTAESRTGRWHPPPTSRQGPGLFFSAALPEPAICQAPASFEDEAH